MYRPLQWPHLLPQMSSFLPRMPPPPPRFAMHDPLCHTCPPLPCMPSSPCMPPLSHKFPLSCTPPCMPPLLYIPLLPCMPPLPCIPQSHMPLGAHAPPMAHTPPGHACLPQPPEHAPTTNKMTDRCKTLPCLCSVNQL